jgi:hypothetical protein
MEDAFGCINGTKHFVTVKRGIKEFGRRNAYRPVW